MVAAAGCLSMPLLRHHLARFSAKLFAINSSSIPPQHKPPSGAKSGLTPKAFGANGTELFFASFPGPILNATTVTIICETAHWPFSPGRACVPPNFEFS